MTNDNQRNLLVMKASAGSGKTYELTERFLEQVAGSFLPPSPSGPSGR